MFEKAFQDSLKSDVKLINTVIKYTSKIKGKQLRPRLTLLAARTCGEPTELTSFAAALVEIIHVATLIHDDVVDGAEKRRGWPSINKIWKNKISILIGDFMFSKALTAMIQLKNSTALGLLSKTAERLSQGEILQIEKAIKKDMTENIYFKMVSDKTASLFATACELGAITTTDDKNKRLALKGFGEDLGIAFQIKDDLLDITGNIDGLGKPAGFDIKKNMLTLPLIHLFSSLNKSKRKKVKRLLKHHLRRNQLCKIRELIEENGSILYTENMMKNISSRAESNLKIFPDSEYKLSLLGLLQFNLERNY